VVAKICSDRAKPNGILWVLPGQEAAFLAPLEVRKMPGVGKVTEESLREIGIRKLGELAALEDDFLESRFGAWGPALKRKAAGEDAGGWFDEAVGEDSDPKSISHEHTYNVDTADAGTLDSTIARLSEMVGRRLREQGLHARTIQLKLRYSDFTTITRAHSLKAGTQVDVEILREARALFQKNWKKGEPVRLLGVQASSLQGTEGQLDLMGDGDHQRWKQALATADRLRDKYGDSAIVLGSGMKGGVRERVHENPAARPSQTKQDPKDKK
jgi:DNA polymerase-4